VCTLNSPLSDSLCNTLRPPTDTNGWAGEGSATCFTKARNSPATFRWGRVGPFLCVINSVGCGVPMSQMCSLRCTGAVRQPEPPPASSACACVCVCARVCACVRMLHSSYNRYPADNPHNSSFSLVCVFVCVIQPHPPQIVYFGVSIRCQPLPEGQTPISSHGAGQK